MVMRYVGGGIGHFNQSPPLDETIEIDTAYSTHFKCTFLYPVAHLYMTAIDDTQVDGVFDESVDLLGKDQARAKDNPQAKSDVDEEAEEEEGLWGDNSGSESDCMDAEEEEDEDFVDNLYDL
jgi:hypothetical protein